MYRFGRRQTFDIVIPLPGVRIWALHHQLFEIIKRLKVPFVFALKSEELNNGKRIDKAIELEVPS